MLGASAAVAVAALQSVAARGQDIDARPVLWGLVGGTLFVIAPPLGREWPSFAGPLAATAAATLAGVLSSRFSGSQALASRRSTPSAPPLTAGIAVGLSAAALTLAAGQSASLSTLDTRPAFAVINGPGGLTSSVLLTLALNAVPLLIVGWAVARRDDAPRVLGVAAQTVFGQAALFAAAHQLAFSTGTDAAVRLTACWAVLLLAAGGFTLVRSVRETPTL